MQPILQVGLSKAGYVCTFTQPLVYGPQLYARLAIPHLHTEQLLVQLIMILQYGHDDTKDLASILIQVNAEVMRLEVGMSGELWDIPVAYQSLVTHMWIKCLWIQCQQWNIHIQSDSADVYPQWQGDME